MKKFKKTELLRQWYGEEVEGFEEVADMQTDSGRWESHHLFVFRDLSDNKHYGFEYSRGLTEFQEAAPPPFYFDGDEVELNEFEPFIVQEIKWRPLTAGSTSIVDGTVISSKTIEPESK